MPEQPRAVVREIGGQLVLDDPDALAVMQAVAKANCEQTLSMNADRVAHFKRRATDLGKTPADVVITVINVDDVNGGLIAEAFMPGHDWQEIRDRGEVPFARGLAKREGIQEILATFDEEAATALQAMNTLAVVVVDHGVAAVFAA